MSVLVEIVIKYLNTIVLYNISLNCLKDKLFIFIKYSLFNCQNAKV